MVESQEDAKSLIQGLESALLETPDILDDTEYSDMQTAINTLQKAINSDNRDIILLKSDDLNKLANGFVQKHLDHGVDLFLKNRHVDEIKFDK